MTCKDDHFNIYFAGNRSLYEWFSSRTVSQSVVAYTMLIPLLTQLESYFNKEGLVTINPMLTLMFKDPNDYFDSRGVSFLLTDI